MTNQLTPYQMNVWRHIKAGGHLVRQMPIRARKRTRIKLVTKEGIPVMWVKSSCLYRLNNLNRLAKYG